MAESSSQQKCNKVWKALWQLWIPQVEKVCFWRACHDILPTRDRLFRRKVISDPSCPICGLEAETIAHILWHCPLAQDVWSGGCTKFQKSSYSDQEFLQIAESMLEKCDVEEFQTFVMVTRRIWLRRNEFMYEGAFSPPGAIIKQAETVIKDYNQAQSGEMLRGF